MNIENKGVSIYLNKTCSRIILEDETTENTMPIYIIILYNHTFKPSPASDC